MERFINLGNKPIKIITVMEQKRIDRANTLLKFFAVLCLVSIIIFHFQGIEVGVNIGCFVFIIHVQCFHKIVFE